MKRETCMLRLKCGMENPMIQGICHVHKIVDKQAHEMGAQNLSAWTVSGFLYLYAEFDDDSDKGLKDLIAPWEDGLLQIADYLAKPGEAEIVYTSWGIVQQDKAAVRRRVFATKLKPGCAETYKERHRVLMENQGAPSEEDETSNFTIWCINDTYIFGYSEKLRALEHPMSEEEKASTIEWETRQLEIMDWLTDDVDWITGQKHPRMRQLYVQNPC